MNVDSWNDESSGDDDVLNDDQVMMSNQSHTPNASDSADTSLQEEHDDFGNLFEEIETPLLFDENFESCTKFIEFQRSDRSVYPGKNWAVRQYCYKEQCTCQV